MSSLFDDPNWPRAGAWLTGEGTGETVGSLTVIGAPVRLGSITPGRCDLAPQAVRAALRRFSIYDIETDTDLRALSVTDQGDLPLADATLTEAFVPLRDAVRNATEQGTEAVIVLGGDNGVTRPSVHGLLAAASVSTLAEVGLLTLDAHFDLRDLSNGLTNGNPVRALLADGLPGENIVQLGIMGFANSQAYARIAREAGIGFVTMDRLREKGIEQTVTDALAYLSSRAKAIYVDLDMDVMDRAFAPACPGARPGGLLPWELKRAAWLCGNHAKVRMLDLVEVDPTQDVATVTVMTTAACLLSFTSGLINRKKANV